MSLSRNADGDVVACNGHSITANKRALLAALNGTDGLGVADLRQKVTLTTRFPGQTPDIHGHMRVLEQAGLVTTTDDDDTKRWTLTPLGTEAVNG